jgi:hypothetical protein
MDAQPLETTFSHLLENIFLVPAVARIADALDALASNSASREQSPQLRESHEHYLAMQGSKDSSEKESALLELYLRLHALGWSYSNDEEKALARALGNTNIPGGLAPLVLAGEFMRPGAVSADLGAGNGLQGLLMQYLYPHQKTILIELSSSMVETGKRFQKILGIPDEKVLWVQDDIKGADFSESDLVYLYRPARPHGEGNALYHYIAEQLGLMRKPVVVISVADCLGHFLGAGFTTVFENEHISVFQKTSIE